MSDKPDTSREAAERAIEDLWSTSNEALNAAYTVAAERCARGACLLLAFLAERDALRASNAELLDALRAHLAQVVPEIPNDDDTGAFWESGFNAARAAMLKALGDE